MVNDRRIAEAPAGDSDMRNSDAVASTDDCRSQAINKEVHHSLRDGRDSDDDVAVGTSEVAGTLTAYRGTGFRSSGTITVGLAITRRGPRYLTPRECERLQGMPDDYTLVPFRKNKLAADSPRYKALGNSMAVPVMAWIGRRITRAFAKADVAGPTPGPTPPMLEVKDRPARDSSSRFAEESFKHQNTGG